MPQVVALTKVCTACEQHKPLDAFYRKTNGRLFSRCKECTAADKAEYWKDNKEARLARQKASGAVVTPTGLTRRAGWDMQSRYGMSEYEYRRRMKAQGFKCACCSGPFDKICIDHDHVTGVVRGLVCRGCNLMLGHAKDSIDVLRKAIKYLGRHKSQL